MPTRDEKLRNLAYKIQTLLHGEEDATPACDLWVEKEKKTDMFAKNIKIGEHYSDVFSIPVTVYATSPSSASYMIQPKGTNQVDIEHE